MRRPVASRGASGRWCSAIAAGSVAPMQPNRRPRAALFLCLLGLPLGTAHAATASGAAPGGHPLFGDYLAAAVALQSTDYDYAAEHMLRALGADPRNRPLREQAFVAASLAGRPEAPLLASGLTNNTAADLVTGNAAVVAGHWSDAQRAYGALPADRSLGDLLRPVLVAWSQFGAGHADAALQTLAPAVAGDRLPGFYALQAALLADADGRPADAAADYRLAQEASPGLNLSLARLIASFQARTGHPDEGRALVHALVTSVPTLAVSEAGIDASLLTRPVTDARQGIAHAYLSAAALMTAPDQSEPHDGEDSAQGQSTSALLLLRFAAVLDPASGETRLVMSDIEASLHNNQAALDALAPVRQTEPLYALVQLRRAELSTALGRDGEARRIYGALIGAFPSQAEPAREDGELLNDEHRYNDAADRLSLAIADTKNPGGDDWSLFFDRAVAYDRSRQWPRAEADLRRALQLSPDQPFVLNYLGYSYAEQDRNLEEARHMLERALAQKPHDGAFLDSLGWIILKQKHVGEAIAQLQEAAELTPEDPTVNYHLGVAYWEAGRRVEAENQWRRALILNPDADDLPKIQAHLREADAGPARGGGAAAVRQP